MPMAREYAFLHVHALGPVQSVSVLPENGPRDPLVCGGENLVVHFEQAAVIRDLGSGIGFGYGYIPVEAAMADRQGDLAPAAFHAQRLFGLGDPDKAERALST